MLRPALEDANVKGCKVSRPGEYSVAVGDWVELSYVYPVVPSAIPKKIEATIDNKNIGTLGKRRVSTPGVVGSATVAFHFEALAVGAGTITLVVDDNVYVYKVTVRK